MVLNRIRISSLLGRCLALVVAAGVLAGPVGAASTDAPQREPRFDVRLAFRDGRLVVDAQRSTVDLGVHRELFEGCGLTPQVLTEQLVQRLDGLYASLGPVFERLAVPQPEPPDTDSAATERRAATLARLRALAQADDATRRLLALAGTWPEVKAALRAWRLAHAADQPPVFTAEPVLDDLYLQARTLAPLIDSPLLPQQRDPSAPPEGGDFEAGRIVYVLSPPLMNTQNVLRPDSNKAEWNAVRAGLGDDALGALRCRLWNRQPVLDAVQDYLAVRGHDVAAYRRADERDTGPHLGLADLPPQPAPEHHAGVSPERTRFADPRPGQPPGYGGRVLLLPDPLVRTVFIQTGRGGQRPQQSPWPALYLLLPSDDYALVRAEPGRYLCSTVAVWKTPIGEQPRPAAVRLDLDARPGRSLALARLYLTQRELAVRLQRLAAVEQSAGVNFTRSLDVERRRDTALIIAPLADGEGGAESPAAAVPGDAGAMAGISPCPETAAPQAGAAKVATSAKPQALPDPPQADAPSGSADNRSRRATDGPKPKPKPHEVQLSLDKPAGKPAALGLLYTHQGLLPGDRFSVGFGHQRQRSAEGRYSSDFVAFDALQRRLQLAAAVTRTPLPDRPIDSGRGDEQRDGAELAATLDLWRDRAGTFGQGRLALTRARITPAGADQALPEVTTLRWETTVVAQRRLSAAAPTSEGTLTLGRGRAAGTGFGLAGLELRHQRFVGAFDRVDVHGVASAVGRAAPRSEWLPFGGEDTVRGWRNETVLARRSMALQLEYWTRLPWMPSSGALERVFRRELALALFTDIGRAEPPAGAADEARRTFAGAGVGLRYTAAAATPVTMKLDLARPLSVGGMPADGERKLRLHFSVSVQPSL